MKKIHFYIVLLLIIYQNIQSQNSKLSVYSEISIITVGPGNVLFEAFGHSAIRVKDPVLRMDAVYNYGLFDYNQPNFGVGFLYNGIQIDYALTNIGSLGNALFSNIFSVKIDFSFFRR